jgi:hypothetical protein
VTFGAYGKICLIAFAISIIDALESCAALPSRTQSATVFRPQAISSALPLSPSTLIIIVDFSDGQATSPECHSPEPQEKNLDLLGRQSSTSWMPTNELGSNSEKGTSEL